MGETVIFSLKQEIHQTGTRRLLRHYFFTRQKKDVIRFSIMVSRDVFGSGLGTLVLRGITGGSPILPIMLLSILLE